MQSQPILGYFWAIFGLYQPPRPPLLDLGPLFTYCGSAPELGVISFEIHNPPEIYHIMSSPGGVIIASGLALS